MFAFTFAIPPIFRRSWLHWLQVALALVITLSAAMPALAGQVGLAWDASVDPTVTGYYVYYGQATRNYTSKIDVGNQTADTVLSLTNGQTYFFTVTAYNAARVESGYSNEVSTTIPTVPAQTALSLNPNPAGIGASVTFTATVTGVAPTGSVTFTDGATAIAGCNAVSLGGSGNIRTAVCNSSSLGAGTHSIVARYNGDAGNGASSSSPVSEVITAGSSTTTVVSSANPATIGTGVTFTATVTGVAPTGTVSFTDAGAAIGGCNAVALGGSGNIRTAMCNSSSLGAGTHSIVARYNGDAGNGASSSSPVSEVITAGSSSTTVVSSANPATIGTGVTFTATVTGVAPTGTVSFTDAGAAIGGCSAVALGGSGNIRTAMCNSSSLGAGTHSIVARYNGDAGNGASSSSPVSEVITAGSSSTTVVSSANPATIGTGVTFTATVTGVAPTGAVNFTDAGAVISGCSAVALLGGSGNIRTAVCATNTLAVGAHSVAAVYTGDAGNGMSSSSPVFEAITAGSSSTAVASSANPAAVSTGVTFTAMVTGAAPTGTVSFTDAGAMISGCSAVALGSTGNTRMAVCATNALSVGTHNVVAAYGGDASNGASSSSTLLETINPANNSVVLVSSQNPAKAGTGLNLTATVTGIAPTGSVSFSDGGTPIAGCTAIPLAGVGNSRGATCSAVKLAIGTHTIAAAYAGDSGNAASISNTLAQVITPPSSTRKHQGLWWVPGGAESGWGVNLAHQGDQVFATWYTYDTNGNPYWLSMLANLTAPGGDTYSGDIFTDVGPSFANFTGAATATKVGSGSLSFSDTDNGSFSYSISAGGANNLQQTKAITRFVLEGNSAQPACSDADASTLPAATNYQDLWWNPGEPGWGVNFAHQDNLLFATWYTYGTNNAPLWLSALMTRRGTSNIFSGTIYLTYGPRLDSYVAPPSTEQVGVATVTFTSGMGASFSVTTTSAGGLPAAHSTKVITRFLFAPQSGTVCN